VFRVMPGPRVALLPAALLCLALCTDGTYGVGTHGAGRCKSVQNLGRIETYLALAHGQASGKAWNDDADPRCFCFEAQPWTNMMTWGKTRLVKLEPYDQARMHLWVRDSEEGVKNEFNRKHADDWLVFLFKFANAIPSLGSHSCSSIPFLLSQQKCLVRASPFERQCVGIKAVPNMQAELTVQDEYDSLTLSLMLSAIVLFVVAPSASHSLWCYYLSSMIFMTVFCVGVLGFLAWRKAFGGYKRATLVAIFSWWGAIKASMLHSLIQNKWAMLMVAVCALAGFLLAYSFPPVRDARDVCERCVVMARDRALHRPADLGPCLPCMFCLACHAHATAIEEQQTSHDKASASCACAGGTSNVFHSSCPPVRERCRRASFGARTRRVFCMGRLCDPRVGPVAGGAHLVAMAAAYSANCATRGRRI
jgi:hypothetical protein